MRDLIRGSHLPSVLAFAFLMAGSAPIAAGDKPLPVHAATVSSLFPLMTAGTTSIGPGGVGLPAASLATNVALSEALNTRSASAGVPVLGADALALSLLGSSSPSMDLTMLFQLQALYQQMAMMEALMMAQGANNGFYPAPPRTGGLGALGAAAYRGGLGNGGQRLAPFRPGIGPRRTLGAIPVGRNQPRPPPPPRSPRHH
jgi:hypothetical protein